MAKIPEVNPRIKRQRIPETKTIVASIAEMTIVFPKSGSFAIRSSGGKLAANIFKSKMKSYGLSEKGIFHYDSL